MDTPVTPEPTLDKRLETLSRQLSWANVLLFVIVALLVLIAFGFVAVEIKLAEGDNLP